VSVDRQLVSRLRDDVADRLAARARSEREDGAEPMTSVAQRRYGRGIAAELLEDHARRRIDAGGDPLTPDEEDELAQAIDDALFGLGALQPLLEDVSIENVNANGCDETWITRADGTKERGPALAASDDELVALVRTAAAREGLAERRFDLGCPRLNLQLRDGSRLFAVMGVSRRPALAIRRHRYTKLALEDLVGLGTLDAALRDFLAAATAAKLNTVISGGTSSGKTTLLRALASEIPPHERLAVEHTNVLIANAVDLVVFIGQDRVPGHRIRRYVSSVREVVQAEGPLVVSNEIFRPGPDGRAVPGVPLRHETLKALEAVGFVADVLDRPDGWWDTRRQRLPCTGPSSGSACSSASSVGAVVHRRTPVARRRGSTASKA
jgi:Flp pilus assembly CpaF family ATPase